MAGMLVALLTWKGSALRRVVPIGNLASSEAGEKITVMPEEVT